MLRFQILTDGALPHTLLEIIWKVKALSAFGNWKILEMVNIQKHLQLSCLYLSIAFLSENFPYNQFFCIKHYVFRKLLRNPGQSLLAQLATNRPPLKQNPSNWTPHSLKNRKRTASRKVIGGSLITIRFQIHNKL